ncbi:MAG: L,D-transpeptidase family protein [Sulfuricurvum sp.]
MLNEETVSVRVPSGIETTESGPELVQFYKDGQCNPVWSNENIINSQAIYLMYAIKEFAADGLDIYDPAYNFESILELMNFTTPDSLVKNDPIVLAQLDILLTDAYLMLGKHLYYGFMPSETVSSIWTNARKREPIDLGQNLRKALHDENAKESLNHLLPSSHSYEELRRIMMKYLKIQEAGGWKMIQPVSINDKGFEQYSLADIQERLRVEGDLSGGDDSNEGYENAIKNFQSRHGIRPDGKVGIKTLSKMNIPIEEKIASIRLNMEKLRWIPEENKMFISVNIPDFSLSVINHDSAELTMKAILGKEARQTPIFSAYMKYIVVNPYWRVPSTILREDILPKVQKDIRYLKRERIRIFKAGNYTGNKEINPWTINWKQVNASTFPYIFRQDSGKKNVLGKVKFIFPNPYDIYIHDTPDKNLFDKNIRLFSSGCIRIQEPLKLARYLLQNGQYPDITDLITSGANKKIFLPRFVKVRIDYWTVWEDDNGLANFRDDVYGYDRELMELLGWIRE